MTKYYYNNSINNNNNADNNNDNLKTLSKLSWEYSEIQKVQKGLQISFAYRVKIFDLKTDRWNENLKTSLFEAQTNRTKIAIELTFHQLMNL